MKHYSAFFAASTAVAAAFAACSAAFTLCSAAFTAFLALLAEMVAAIVKHETTIARKIKINSLIREKEGAQRGCGHPGADTN